MSNGCGLEDFEASVSGQHCAIQKRDFDWRFTFGAVATLDTGGLWRLVGPDSIVVTSRDDTQVFGGRDPVDAAQTLHSVLAEATVQKVAINKHTSDLSVWFDNGLELQILQDSSGYEAWELQYQNGGDNQRIVAQGGGRIIFL